MLAIKNLKKTYPSGVQALKGLSLDVSPGMFGLLGPNGAGKTTLMKIVATLLEPDSGSVELNGLDLLARKSEVRQVLGYLPQEFGLYPTLTAEQMLDYFAKLKGVSDKKQRRQLTDALLERVNLSASRAERLGGFSGGMKQRLGIAQALIGEPEILIVDEPTAGLDPEERVRFHNLLSEMASNSSVVILSTHIVSDVSSLCSNMAVIRRGGILATGTPQQALDELKDSVWEATISRERVAALRSDVRVISSHLYGGQVRLRVLSRNERPGPEFVSVPPVLEDYYLSIINQSEPA